MLLWGEGGSGQGRGSWLNHKPGQIRDQDSIRCQYGGSGVLPCLCRWVLEGAAHAATSRFLVPASCQGRVAA